MRVACVLALLLVVSAVTGPASAQTALLRGVPDGAVIQPVLREGVHRARVIDADAAALRSLRPMPPNALASASSSVTLDLFPDVQVSVALEQRHDLPDGAVTFVGAVVGEPGGRAYFAVVDGALAADVILPHARYEVRLRPDGRHQVQAVDGSFVCGVPHQAGAATAPARGSVTESVLEGPPVVVDVLLVYTPRAAAGSGGPAGIRSIIHLAITAMNDALERSLVPHRVRAVHVAPTSYVESGRYGGGTGDLSRVEDPDDGYMDEVPRLRESVQADLVALVAGSASDYSGLANLMLSFDPSVEGPRAYSVSLFTELSDALPHELGHNLGLAHDYWSAEGARPLQFHGHGYQVPGQFRTIMALACRFPLAACPMIPYFSNPSVLFNGIPTGEDGISNEALALTESMPAAASYQGCRVRLVPSDQTYRLPLTGGSVSFDVVPDSECVWLSSPRFLSWIRGDLFQPVRGPGRVTFDVDPNTTNPSLRSQAIVIGGQTVTIEQPGCVNVTSPETMRFTASGGQGAIVIDAPPGCPWSFDPPGPGAVFTPTSALSGSGPGQLTFTLAPRAGLVELPLRGAVTLRSGAFLRVTQLVQDGNGCADAIAVSPVTFIVPGGGGTQTLTIAAPPSCTWSLNESPAYVSAVGPGSGTGSGSVTVSIAANPDGAGRRAPLSILGRTAYFTQAGCAATVSLPADVSAEGGQVDVPVSTPWTCGWTLTVTTTAMRWVQGSSSGTGAMRFMVASNPDETPRQLTFTVNGEPYAMTQRGRSEPVRRYLSEGATGSFFSTRLAILNPGGTTVEGQLRFQRADGSVRTRSLTVPARRRMTITPESVPDLGSADFATVLESSGTLLMDRTMTWDRSGFGSHAETSLPEPSRTWYLAEGSTAGDFSLFYLLQNPNPAATVATITFLLPGGAAPIVRTFPLGPSSRRTIPIDGLGPPLDATDLSAVITAPDPIIVERAMYATRAGQPFAAGHNSAGVTAPSLQWFLAEGATGSFFDLFILIANPNQESAALTAEYLLPGGRVLTKNYVVPGNSRHTIYVDDEQLPAGSGVRPLSDVSVSTTIRSTNGVPVIVERAMWWPGPQMGPDYWTEAHNSPGATVTGTRWALAEGEAGGPNDAETYILIANTSAFAGTVRVQLLLDDGRTTERTLSVPAKSRATVAGSSFTQAASRRFGAIVESLGSTPAQIVVERAMYTNANGVFWAAGTNALATRLAP